MPHETAHAPSKKRENEENWQIQLCCFNGSVVDEEQGSESKISVSGDSDPIRKDAHHPVGSLHCRICLEPLCVGDVVAVPKHLPCEHYNFHSHCIIPWLLRNNSCPICRAVYVIRRKHSSRIRMRYCFRTSRRHRNQSYQLETSIYCEAHGLITPGDQCVALSPH